MFKKCSKKGLREVRSVRTFFFTLQVLARAVVPSLVRSLKHPKSAERTPLQWLEDARKEQFEQTGSVHGLLTYRS